ncbi:hypothetical protein JDV02_009512 [Purpureocillium takamizusanense]|uniref:Zn(2)-C6 fungal-type domain-containing protein n=1 Tax=Purpureocillium takamizusanense TaxID=2060973 RepID=A0A9Q8QQ40_9HYPO|nr:uncharacterized protein JDV02_009512 [Purpureocillium takamizusanense]UNI23708.1 hypothetical protein JDV02_009512 [Purpureocillium takamizusanense]
MAPSSNTSEQGGFSGWVAKPPRMRTACTQCHAAKIRCSGDKSGCQRCNSLGLHCEYVVSMVGRTPKRQRKSSEARSQRAHPSPPESQPSEQSLPRSSCPSTSGSVSEASVSAANAAGDNFDVSRTIFVSGPSMTQTDFTDDQLFDYLNDESWASGGAAVACPTGIDDGQNFPEATGFEIEGFSIPQDINPPATSGPCSSMAMPVNQPPSQSSGIPSFFPMSPRSPSHNAAAASGQSSQDWAQFVHVVALCKMVRLLESHVQTKSTAVDEVMRLNQACIRDISKISAKKEYMQCRSCPALISTIMELIVTLYEDITKHPSHEQLATSALSTPNAPFLQFGVFELDPEEQTVIRNRIIRKEAQKCVQIIQFLKRLLESELNTPDKGSAQSQALGNWYEGMERRMSDLVSSLVPLT